MRLWNGRTSFISKTWFATAAFWSSPGLLEKAGFTPLDVGLGTVVVQEKPGREQREAFRKLLEAYGFELIDDSRMRLIEQIRTAVIELVHYSEDASKVNLSDYLLRTLPP